MFVHAGAGLHGHEYSESRRSPPPQPSPLSFFCSAMIPSPDNERGPSSSSSTPPPSSSSYPFVSDQLPVASTTSSSEQPSLPRPPRRRPNSLPAGIPKKDLSVTFREPTITRVNGLSSPHSSEDEDTLVDVGINDHVPPLRQRRRRKSAPRSSTRFALAHPAPQFLNKQRSLVQIRPRLMLQLQQLGPKRAVPAFDVVPSALLVGSIIIPKLAKAFPRVFHVKPKLNQDDLLVVRNEDYTSPLDGPHAAGDSEQPIDQRELVAVISPLPQQGLDNVEIIMEDGSVWLSAALPNNSFEFTHTDPSGQITTARWVKRLASSSSTGTLASARPSSPEPRWIFSILDPDTRKHPILGTLTASTLEIYDSYNVIPPMGGYSSPASPTHTVDTTLTVAGPLSPRATARDERVAVEVSENYKRLMLATAIWVSLRQSGWPRTAKPKLARSVSQQAPASPKSLNRSRSLAEYTDSPIRASMPSPSRRFSGLSLQECVVPEEEPKMPPRAMSMGATYAQDRRRAPELGVNNVLEEQIQPKPRRCSLRVRQFTNKIFHRRNSQVSEEKRRIASS
ncbi:hypothetical protein B0I35DRAFT_480642 [Stachybotrys elegans]|uniref:Uncharacterized protein n=1 Tax=Stachybotrys elegans TaxID=80388 RepID=A0A8K0SM11_9HYPO|nr:hypothetical protein B0I35DRAFT_480642 [Stachybotrys elegans]